MGHHDFQTSRFYQHHSVLFFRRHFDTGSLNLRHQLQRKTELLPKTILSVIVNRCGQLNSGSYLPTNKPANLAHFHFIWK